jgi:hypothetical protein
MSILVSTGNVTEEFSGMTNVVAELLVKDFILPASAKTNV